MVRGVMDIKFNKPYYNVTSEENTVALESAYNVYFEALPQGGFGVRRRPGYSILETIPGIGQGVYWCDRNNSLYFAKSGKIYKKQSTTSSVLVGVLSAANKPVVFAEGQMLDLSPIMYISSGGQLQYLNLNTNILKTTSTGLPPYSSFVACMNNRFYSNDTQKTQDFWITDFNPEPEVMIYDPTYWGSSANPFRAEQVSDVLKGIYSGWNEVYLWGSQACEIWQEDGITPISPLTGSIIECGCEAPYSVVKANNTLIGLGIVAGKRAIVRFEGRAPNILSEPIANRLQELTTVSDAIGTLCFVGGMNTYLITFPTEGITWAYDFKTDTWCQWSTWDITQGQHLAFNAPFMAYAKTWNKHVALGYSGNIYEMSRSVYSDNTTPIRSSITTGWLDHGTYDRKRSDQLIIKLKGYSNVAGKVVMRFRDDGRKEWSLPVDLELQYNSQNDSFAKLNRMGMYRSRQYEFVLTAATDMALIGMEEDLTKMRF